MASDVTAAGQSRVGESLIDRRAANQRPGVGAACLDGMKTSLGQKTKSTNVRICNNSFVQQSCAFIAYLERELLVGLKHVRNNAKQRWKCGKKESHACVGQHLMPESATHPQMSGPVFYVRGAAGTATCLDTLPHTNVHSYATRLADRSL